MRETTRWENLDDATKTVALEHAAKVEWHPLVRFTIEDDGFPGGLLKPADHLIEAEEIGDLYLNASPQWSGAMQFVLNRFDRLGGAESFDFMLDAHQVQQLESALRHWLRGTTHDYVEGETLDPHL